MKLIARVSQDIAGVVIALAYAACSIDTRFQLPGCLWHTVQRMKQGCWKSWKVRPLSQVRPPEASMPDCSCIAAYSTY